MAMFSLVIDCCDELSVCDTDSPIGMSHFSYYYK